MSQRQETLSETGELVEIAWFGTWELLNSPGRPVPAEWGDGPWNGEPDKVQWVDPATGLDCLAVRSPMGCWCGYVGVPPEHPLHGCTYDDVDPDVHGGLTFADSCMEDAPEGTGVCHVPFPGRPGDVWWFGFDCGHFMDLVPAMEAARREVAKHDPQMAMLEEITKAGPFQDIYRTLSYVRAETTSLAAQLHR